MHQTIYIVTNTEVANGSPSQNWKNYVFLEKNNSYLRFFRYQCTKKTGHKIKTQEEHAIHVTSFSINHNKTHISRLKYEIKYDQYKIAQK